MEIVVEVTELVIIPQISPDQENFFVIFFFVKNNTVGIRGSVYPPWPPTRILPTSDSPC
jgi:hypothetical protein